ncbi:MAG TPA: hypothetical protein VM689_07155 [Aliidongia sp.]|nr:hypothetical protein [Aliidongia sp.]
MTSRIPPSEWDAIAARREKGESVTFIARTYDASPATIYGILKKVAEARGDREAEAPEPATAAPEPEPAEPEPVPARAPEPVIVPIVAAPPVTSGVLAPAQPRPAPQMQRADRPPQQHQPAQQPPSPQQQQPQPPREPFRFTYENRHVEPPPRQPRPAEPPRPFPEPELKAPLIAELDAELRAQADAAIVKFQTAFETILGQETAESRKELRQAASDLMRVAARTTIALERKEAIVHRMAMPVPQRRPEPPGGQNQNQNHFQGRRPRD